MNKLDEIIKLFSDDLMNSINMLDSVIKDKISEIRIRRNRAVTIVIKNSSYYIDYNGDLYDYACHNAVVVNKNDFDELFLKLCDYSIYSNVENMKKGFITLSNGARVGISGTYVQENQIVKNVDSLNIRIPRQVVGCADKLLNCLYVNSFPSIIVAGKPNSGKTTLLRDIAFQLSNGFNQHHSKVVVVDERNEICPKYNDEYVNEIGTNCDVLSCFSKSDGIEIATRTLSPEMIICDEISTENELNSIRFGFQTGVSFALSVHISSKEDLLRKPIIKSLIETNQFSYIALLDGYTYNVDILDANGVFDEDNRSNNSYSSNDNIWHKSIIR